MPNSDPYTLVKAILAKDFQAQHHRRAPGKLKEPLVITLSRDYGARGEQVAKGLADCLGIPLYDQTILDRVAQRAKVDRFKFEAHDENVAAGISTFLYSLMTGAPADLQTYRHHLFEVILELGKSDALMIGRGAHLILSHHPIFRIRVVGSRLACAERLVAEHGIDLAEAERRVFEINNKRHQSIQNLFADSFEQPSLEHAANFDLVINTDHMTPESAVTVILLAIQEAGFDVSSRVEKR